MSKMKKLLAMLLALAMVLGMSMTTMAAITGSTITVNGLSTATDEKGNVATQEVKIYEIYRLDANNNLWVLSDWAKKAEVLNSEADLANPDKIKLLAEKAPTIADATATTTTGTLTISKTDSNDPLQAGAYLVIATDTLNETKYNPMVAVTYTYDENGDDDDTNLLVAANASVTAKASEYDIDKNVVDDNDKVYEVGDLVKYEVRTTVPYIAKDETPKAFTITDKLEGATYFLIGKTNKEEAAVSTVTVGGETVTGIAIPSNAHGKTTFTLDLSALVSVENTYAGKEVVITYTAMVVAADSVSNKVSSTYVPNVEKETTSYTGQATITKYNADRTETLSDATFVLYRTNEDGSIEYAKLDVDKYVTGEWTNNINDAGTVVTDEDGLATIKGLDVGTYYFKETIAPDGYSVNAAPKDVVEVVVTKTEAEGVVTVAGSAEMQNSKLITLPSTGGIGTTIFTIAGCGIMIAAAYLFFASRRREEA